MVKKYITLLGLYAIFMSLLTSCNDENLSTIAPNDSIEKKSRAVTVVFHDETISANKTVSGSDIAANNIVVNNRAKLTLQASNVVITPDFVIEAGSQLEITH